MARLQILELPEGVADDRPPFVLVVDECVPQRYVIAGGDELKTHDPFNGVAEKIGARAVIVFEETVKIPANDVSGFTETSGAERIDGFSEALARVRNLHRPVEYRGQTICWECSAYDILGKTTDNAPCAYDQCSTIQALDGLQGQT